MHLVELVAYLGNAPRTESDVSSHVINRLKFGPKKQA